MDKALKRDEAALTALAEHERATACVEAMEQRAPSTRLARLVDRLRWQRRAARLQVIQAARDQAETARFAQATARTLATGARRSADKVEAEWRKATKAEAEKLARQAEWLAAAIATIERTPLLGLESDAALAIEVRQELRRRSQPPPDPEFGPRFFDDDAPAYRPPW